MGHPVAVDMSMQRPLRSKAAGKSQHILHAIKVFFGHADRNAAAVVTADAAGA
jgi:hypothetical protein